MTIFFTALARQKRTMTLADGLKAFVQLYYDNYTDAVSIEPDVMRTLRDLMDAVDVGIDLDDLIHETETSINGFGGVEGSDGVWHTVCTPVDVA